MAVAVLVLFRGAALMLACRAMTSVSPVAAFAGIDIQAHRRTSSTTMSSVNDAHRRLRAWRALGAKAQNDDGGEEDDGDPLSDDQREGMADAFSALDSLSADDFDDLRPPAPAAAAGAAEGFDATASSQLFADMHRELSAGGEEGVYADMLGDLSGGDPPQEEGATELRRALDEAAERAAVLDDADGLGALAAAAGDAPTPLTTADVAADILTQDIVPAVSMEEFMSSAVQEAVEAIENAPEAASTSASALASASAPAEVGRTEDIARATEELLENAELRKEIEDIFDRAGDQLRSELDAIKKEQEAFARDAARQGTEVSAAEEQRLSEAERSVARMIQKVARETDGVQQAMDGLERAKDEANEGDGVEAGFLALKQGGLLKQAALIGGLLLGSRAFTEALLVVGSAYGEEHFVPALVQGCIALACAAYFFLVK